jgi:hypothetical protein
MGAWQDECPRRDNSQPDPSKAANSSKVRIHNSFDWFGPGYRSTLRARPVPGYGKMPPSYIASERIWRQTKFCATI